MAPRPILQKTETPALSGIPNKRAPAAINVKGEKINVKGKVEIRALTSTEALCWIHNVSLSENPEDVDIVAAGAGYPRNLKLFTWASILPY